MPSHVLKKFIRPKAEPYQFPDAEGLSVDQEEAARPPEEEGAPGEGAAAPPDSPEPGPAEEGPQVTVSDNPVRYAQIQAEAILNTARTQAEELRALSKAKAQQELDQIREGARQEGFREGYAQGLASAAEEARKQKEALSAAALREVEAFLEQASQLRDELLDNSKRDMCDLAVSVAEKVVRVSLKSSTQVIARMIQAATEKLKRREWVHIYISGSDAKGIAQIAPQLTVSLAALSDHIKIVPMNNEESGTCIIEMPDTIIDASASTQLNNLRSMLEDLSPDDPPPGAGFRRRATDQ